MKRSIMEAVAGQRIFTMRGMRIMLDKDLARLYGVDPRALRQQVKRNRDRFPDDFMFQLTEEEFDVMVSHFVTPSRKRFGGFLPYAFTEQGVAMLSGILRSKRAIQANIAIMRAFVKLREVLATHAGLTQKLKELEGRVGKHDEEIGAIFEAIRRLMAPPPEKPKPRIGFHP